MAWEESHEGIQTLNTVFRNTVLLHQPARLQISAWLWGASLCTAPQPTPPSHSPAQVLLWYSCAEITSGQQDNIRQICYNIMEAVQVITLVCSQPLPSPDSPVSLSRTHFRWWSPFNSSLCLIQACLQPCPHHCAAIKAWKIGRFSGPPCLAQTQAPLLKQGQRRQQVGYLLQTSSGHRGDLGSPLVYSFDFF